MATQNEFTPEQIRDGIQRLAQAIAEAEGDGPVLLVGILSSGLPLAQRLAALIGARAHHGSIDIGLYRDDAHLRIPDIIGSDIPFDLDEAHVVLVDDVIASGRTVRAAIDHLMDYGRPSMIRLAVLIDRGGRELPIQPDFVAFKRDFQPLDRVKVAVSSDGSVPDTVAVIPTIPVA
jgi:pyrimidine operon attenuation protein/uracil phosphoribosyltransferase